MNFLISFPQSHFICVNLTLLHDLILCSINPFTIKLLNLFHDFIHSAYRFSLIDLTPPLIFLPLFKQPLPCEQ